jgi:transposase-like protein/transposase
MPKHHSEDYKISAVKHYLEKTNNLTATCKEFNCSRISLGRWVDRYLLERSIKRHNRLPVSYKITKKQVKYAIKKVKQNEQISMKELVKIVKKKYDDFDITPQHLGKVLRDNNLTRKRTRHEHFPVMRYGTPIEKQKELDKFYKKVDEYKLNKIISLDETSIKPSMLKEYSRCKLGKRCTVKTEDSYIFRKFTLLVAIKNSKCIGWELYEKGGMKKERLVEFLEKYVFGKYKNHLIILDNAGSHRNNYVKDAITESENNYLFSVPYTPKTNVVEMFFNQIKHYLKLNRKVLKYEDLKKNVRKAIKKVKRENYKKYFLYAYKKNELRKVKRGVSTLKRKPKIYKN